MRCASCGAENPAGHRFCGQCGGVLTRVCSSCGAGAAAGQRFCGACGVELGGPPAAVPAVSGQVAERRVTSVLFADLVGFTSLSEARDPEEVRELLSEYFSTARTVVSRYGGTVEKFIGDAVMAVWGVPAAHEDDAERAVRAGIDLVAAVAAVGEGAGATLTARVGVVTGEVAVTLGAVGEGMVAGDAVNTAARVQAAAEPGQVWVDDATRAMTAAAVSYADAGEHVLKGKAEPLRLFAAQAVIASVGGAQRVDGLEASFVGRDRELRLVKELFHAAAEEHRPQLVAVQGVAGVGKSRLAWEFEKYADGISDESRWHRGRVLSYGDGVAFWALAEMVRSRLGIVDGDPPSVARDRLTCGVAELAASDAERDWLEPRLATLIGLDTGLGADDGSPALAREDLFPAWTTFFERVGGGVQCVILVFDDMHHADAGLLDFLEHLLETSRFPLFVLTLARPELAIARPGWGSGRRATSIYLEPLTAAAMGALVDGLVAGLPDAARSTLVDRAEGIPLYAVETVRTLIDGDIVVPREGRYVLAADAADRVALETLDAPASLHALISARLDALSHDERRLVQDASVHGVIFSRDGLAATTSVTDVDGVLASLTRKEIVAVLNDPFSPERGQYRFVQSLVRTVAYETLSRRDRKARHLAVARLLSTATGDQLAAVVARHYLDALDAAPGDDDAAELTSTALELLEQAAVRALSLGSPDEALRHYRTALSRDPQGEARARLLAGAARAALSNDQPVDAIDCAEKALAAYDAVGQRESAAECVAMLAEAMFSQGRVRDTIELLTPWYEELAAVPDAPKVLVTITEQLARTHTLLQTPHADEFNKRALQLAEASRDWPRLVWCLSRYGVTLATQGAPIAGVLLLSGAADLARERHLPAALIRPLANIAAFSNSRDLERARAAGREALEVSVRLGARDMAMHAAANLAISAWLAGDWDEVDRLRAQHAGTSGTTFAGGLAAISVMADLMRGRAPDGSAFEPDWDVDDPAARYSLVMVRAALAAADGQWAEASRCSSEALDIIYGLSGLEDDFCVLWPQAVDTALAAGRTEEAQRLLALVTDAAPGLVPRLVHAHMLRLRALVNAARGRGETVDADLAAAIEELAAFGAPFFAARAQLDRARFRAAAGDAAAAADLLRECRATFERLGAVPWVTEADRLLAGTPV